MCSVEDARWTQNREVRVPASRGPPDALQPIGGLGKPRLCSGPGSLRGAATLDRTL